MSYLDQIVNSLSNAFCAGSANFRALRQRGSEALGFSPLWLGELCEAVLTQPHLLGNEQQLRAYIKSFPSLQEAYQQGRLKPPLRKYFMPSLAERQTPEFLNQPLPKLQNYPVLLKFLDLTPEQLHWLTKPWLKSHHQEAFPLSHYRYRWVSKNQYQNNSPSFRLLEIPKPLLKRVQQKVAHAILDKVPLHPQAHGFRQGLSIQTCATVHQNKRWVLKMDLEDFFLSITYARVYGIFRHLGYPLPIVRNLSLLTTHVSSERELKRHLSEHRIRQTYHIPHLPQGAPSSPVLSNLAAYRLDCRLSALAQTIGADYSRYADDLFFSGNRYQDFSQLIPYIASICQSERFRINFRKTRIMGRGQQQKILGQVINQETNPPRKEYQRLQAILYNCVHRGVASQFDDYSDRPEHYNAWLQGKIAHIKMLNPQKAARLDKLFQQINWQGK